MKHLSHIDLTSGELQNATIQNITKPPLNPRSGRLYYDVTDKNLKVFSEGKWESCINKVLSVNGEIGEVIISPSVLEFTSTSNFPDEGEQGKIYLDVSSNLLYRWTGSGYVEISSSIVLGETSDTAYAGDKGKIAYDHSLTTHAPSNAQKNSDITKGEIEAKLVGDITTHSHTVTKFDVGLGNVENKSSFTIRGEITNVDVIYALGFTPMDASIKGTNNGVAELDAAGKVPASQLPSYVDDILEFASLSAFPSTGESGKIYTATDTNIIYRWGGTGYVEISSTIALGETNNTAYRGDRGKTAYDHSQAAHAPVDAQKNSNITKGEIEAKLTGVISTHSHTVTKANVGLGNVDNTSDLAKPISTATQTALNTKLDTTVFDNLEIGGRNLLKNTASGVGWFKTDFDAETRTFTRETTSTSESFVVLINQTRLENNSTYTLSAWIRSNGQVKDVDYFVYGKGVTKTHSKKGIAVTTNWQFVTFTFTTDSSTDYSESTIRFDNNGSKTAGVNAILYVKEPKLELGNRATDWTPAPEDQVSDWNESDVNSFAFIKNKPAPYTHPNHTGDVTSTGDGATVITNDSVTNSKLANMSANTIKGRITTAGDPQDLTAAQVKALLSLKSISEKDYWFGTQANYDAISTKNTNTIYFIPES